MRLCHPIQTSLTEYYSGISRNLVKIIVRLYCSMPHICLITFVVVLFLRFCYLKSILGALCYPCIWCSYHSYSLYWVTLHIKGRAYIIALNRKQCVWVRLFWCKWLIWKLKFWRNLFLKSTSKFCFSQTNTLLLFFWRCAIVVDNAHQNTN
jgi:hypothetical protein